MEEKRSVNNVLQMRLNPDLIKEASRVMTDCRIPTKKNLFLKYQTLFVWMEKRKKQGKRIVAVDDQGGPAEEFDWDLFLA